MSNIAKNKISHQIFVMDYLRADPGFSVWGNANPGVGGWDEKSNFCHTFLKKSVKSRKFWVKRGTLPWIPS